MALEQSMNLKILTIGCKDSEDAENWQPSDPDDFDVTVEVLLYDKQRETESMYFEFTVASPVAIGKRCVGGFVPPTLLLGQFIWSDIRRHIERLLMHVKSCDSWECVAFRLGGYMRPSSISSYDWKF
jgi:hypothetical protein